MDRKAVSIIVLTLLLIGMLTLRFNIQLVRAEGTICIRAINVNESQHVSLQNNLISGSRSDAETGPINPVPGQYANFTFTRELYNGTVLSVGYQNVSYSQPQNNYPNCINVSRYYSISGFVSVAWQIVNTTDRSIVDSSPNIWGSYYEHMIPIDATIGQNLTWWSTPNANATIIGQEIISIVNQKVNSWVLFSDLESKSPVDPKDLNNTFWFDKSTGHAVKHLEYETDGIWNAILSATNIPIGVPGDVNGDGKVDVSDLFDLSNSYGSDPSTPNWDPYCDFNKDNRVEALDLYIFSKNYGKTV